MNELCDYPKCSAQKQFGGSWYLSKQVNSETVQWELVFE